MVSSQTPDLLRTHTVLQGASWYQALTLAERLDALHTSAAGDAIEATGNPELAERRLRKWKTQPPFEQASFFADRLALDGTTEEELRALLGMPIETIQAHVTQPPPWLETLVQAFANAGSPEHFVLQGAQQDQKLVELLHPITPLLKQGIARLRTGIQQLASDHAYLPFDTEAIIPRLFSHILTSLLTAMVKTMTLELNIARLQERLQGETAEERFHAFVQHLCEPGEMLALLELYPVLARLLVTILDQGVAFGLELLGHLCTDWQEIRTLLATEQEPGMLVGMQFGAGDAHRQGRSVVILTFDTGFKLVYKPKSLAIDQHFHMLLDWLNAHEIELSLRAVLVLDRGTYGWSEYIQARGCSSPEEVVRFYTRLGGYLALLYTLGGTDFHFENVLACGEHPMFIDLETLFQAELPFQSEAGTPLLPQGFATLQASVMRLGLLPQQIWMTAEGESIDISGLAGKGGQLTPTPVQMLDGIGTDQMHLVRRRSMIEDRLNLPTLEGDSINTMDYLDQVCAGFTRVYHMLIEQREALLTRMLPLFAHDEIRVLLRQTKTYVRVLQESLHPTLLHNALDRDRFLDRLWLLVPRNPFLASVVMDEINDVRENNVPFFSTHVTDRSLFTSRGRQIANAFDESGLDLVEQRIHQLGEQDLARQLWLIRASFATQVMGPGQAIWKSSQLREIQGEAKQEQLLQAARAVGDRLYELAIHGDKDVSWLTLQLARERVWNVSITGFDLYSGITGICLFLAYLGAATDEIKYSTLARKAANTLCEYTTTMNDASLPPGAFNGWGGVLYLYTHLWALWQEPDLLREAEGVVERLAQMIEQDEQFDVIGGVAGSIRSLLALYRISPSQRTLDVALQCGDHLLAHATTTPVGIGWLSAMSPEQPLTGYSHGNAGIALSLLELAALSGEERFRQAALAAMAYERSLFSPEYQNWPDLRPLGAQGSSENTPMVTWCHGAPGIALARLRSLLYIDDVTVREEIASALQTTLSQGFDLNHSLCHGDLGNLDIVLTASQLLDDESYCAEVSCLTAMILDSIERQGWCTGVPLGIEIPGLMTGIAGIGYELLRLARPDLVPSVLSLEPPSMPHQPATRG
ncbi:MAG TPA: type 2 lanthipeptide synthetase LanM family protein [Ktedonosporobacter sp.]|nr:type 2 lanthipeptide synthetase LanM family protein [Ktedonosporobacter sp.]